MSYMKKYSIIKILIILNSLYFLITCLVTYKWWNTDFFNKAIRKPDTLKDAFKVFLNSGLVEEFGIITYIMSSLLFIASLIFSNRLKKWLVVSLIPIIIASLLILCIRYL